MGLALALGMCRDTLCEYAKNGEFSDIIKKAKAKVEMNVEENLLWAVEHSELIVRHLLMPGHVECCWQPAAEWLAAELPGVKVNLRSGFWPAWRAARHPELRGTVSAPESARAVDLARRLGLNLVP